MNETSIHRRDVLKASGIGLLGLAGLSEVPSPTSGHKSVEASATDLLGPIQVPADSDAGFNYPYYLYVPETAQSEPVPMMVEPNNTGTATNDYEQHRTSARKFAEGGLGWTRTFTEALTVPLLVPVLPRPRGDPVDGTHYVHALDETTMNLDSGPLERVDLQLISMIEHAQELLANLDYSVADDILLNGFSASGNFVNRFTGLHPEMVRSVTAGGINGTLLLPLEQDRGHTLNYHIGIADIEAITGEPFDRDRWQDVPQFVFMGGEDENDTIPYSDAWSDEQREIALDVYGEHMQNDRMPYCEGVYEEAGADARFQIYEGVGHRVPFEIQRDIVEFHRENARLKQLSFTSTPTAGDTKLEFDALVFGDRYELRVRSDRNGDLTSSPATIEPGQSVHATVDLTTTLEDGEQITGLVVPAGTSDPDSAVAAVDTVVTDPPFVRVVEPPTEADHTITLRHIVGANYETGSPIHTYVGPANSRSQQMVGTFSPGRGGTETYSLDPTALDVPFESGTELRVQLTDIDSNTVLAAASFTIGGGNSSSADSPATVTFDSQPVAGDESLDIEYAVDGAYQPTKFLTLQADTGAESGILLDGLGPGDAGTETVSMERIPLNAGAPIETSIVDRGTVGRSRTVVVGDTNDAVDLEFTSEPSADDPTGTVEYSIDESYQLRDVLTLRVYGSELPGSVPGQALLLLAPGSSGTATFTVGTDVAQGTDEITLAVIDDVPLALTATTRTLQGVDLPSQTDQNDAATETATDTGSESDTETATAAPETETVTAAPETETATPDTETATASTDSESVASTPDSETGTVTEGQTTGTTATESQTTGTTATGSQSPDSMGTGSRTTDSGSTVSADGPGFGLGAALTGAGGLGYALRRRLGRASSEDDEERP